MNQRKIGSILSYIQMFIQLISTLIFTPLIINYIGDSEFGIYNLSYSMVSYLSLLSLGLGGAYVRFYYKYKTKNNELYIEKLNGLFLSLYSLIAILSLVVGFLMINNLEFIIKGKLTIQEIQLSIKLMYIMVINLMLTFLDTIFNSYITANENFVFQKLVSIFKAIFNPLLGFLFLILGHRSMGLTLAITIITMFSFSFNIIYCIKKLKMRFNFGKPDLKLLKEIFVFSSFVFISMIIDQINWQVDKVIIGKYVGSISVAVYSIGGLINQEYIYFSSAISNVFIARVNHIVQTDDIDRNEQITQLFIKIGRIQLYILMLILVGYISVGKYFIENIWLSHDYHNSYYIGLLLIIPVTIPSIQNVGIEIQKAMNMHKFRSITYLFVAVFNIIVSIMFTKKYGEIGAAAGTSIATLIGNGLLMNWYYHRKIGIDIIKFWKEIFNAFKGGFLPLIISIFISTQTFSNTEFIIFGLFIVIIYFCSIWNFSFNDYEKELLKKIIVRNG